MTSYVRQVKQFRREIKLFLLFNLFSNIGIGVFTLIYNLYLVQIDLHEDFIGTYNAFTTLAMAALALVMGPLIGRYGTWRCLAAGMSAYLVSSLALSVLSNGPAILAIAVISGASTALIFVPIMPFVVEWSRPEARSTVAALTFSLQSVSVTVGSLIGGWSPRLFAAMSDTPIESVGAYRMTLLAGLAVSALGLVPLALMAEARRSRGSETGQALTVTELPPSKRRVRTDMAVFVAAGLLMSLGAGSVVPFYNVYLESLGARPGEIGMIFSVASLVAAVLGLLAPSLSRRFGPLGAVLVLRALPIPVYGLLALMPSLGIAVLGQILRSVSISMAWPIDSTFISEVLPGRARANVFSLRSGAWNLGYALASFVAGQAIVSRGYTPSFTAFVVFSALSSWVFVGYFWRHYGGARRRRLTEAEPEVVGSAAP